MGIFLYSAAGREQQTAIYTFLRYLLRKEKALKKNKVLKGRTAGSTGEYHNT
jgi:hypothetical protein